MVALIVGILSSVIAWAICKEVDGWGPSISKRALLWAVERMPEGRRERYYEEWSAHLGDMPTALSKLFVSLQFCTSALRYRIENRQDDYINSFILSFSVRGLDLMMAVGSGIILLPLMIFLMVWIKLSDGGPILYRHRRIGLHGEPFYCYKFRTMRVDAAEVLTRHLRNDLDARKEWEETGKLSSDPRFTRIGRVMYETTLHELPIIYNVLVGTMTMVGPSPIVEDEIEKYGRNFERYKKLRPGLTSIGQFYRGSKDRFRRKVAADRLFLRHRSFSLIVRLLFSNMWAIYRLAITDIIEDWKASRKRR